MKKQYNQPETVSTLLQVNTIICASGGNNGDDPTTARVPARIEKILTK